MWDGLIGWLLWAAGAGNLIVLVSGLQVPRELHWRTELAKVSPLNRRVVWSMWILTVITLIGLGLVTLLQHDQFMKRNPVAVAVAGFGATFWITRLGLDLFFYKWTEWPQGRYYAVVHVLLMLLWAGQSLAYSAYVAWALLE